MSNLLYDDFRKNMKIRQRGKYRINTIPDMVLVMFRCDLSKGHHAPCLLI